MVPAVLCSSKGHFCSWWKCDVLVLQIWLKRWSAALLLGTQPQYRITNVLYTHESFCHALCHTFSCHTLLPAPPLYLPLQQALTKFVKKNAAVKFELPKKKKEDKEDEKDDEEPEKKDEL